MNQRHQKLLTQLPTKQQTFDFGTPSIWQQLSTSQRREWIAAIAELVFQVAANEINHEQFAKGNDDDE